MNTRNGPAGSGHSTAAGIAFAALSAACFATKGLFAKLLYAHGWSSEAVLTTRSVLALPVIAAWTLWRVDRRLLARAPRAAILGAALAGALCYYVGSSLDFYALVRLDVGVERVLLFTYPSMVVVLYAIAYRQLPPTSVVVALAVTYLGILMVVSGFDLRVLGANVEGSALVLGCALTMALYYLASARWTAHLGSAAFTLLASAAATACLVVQYLLRHGLTMTGWNGGDGPAIAGLVIVATVVPMLALAEGVRLLGAERAALVSSVGPPTTLLLGAWLLGERMRLTQWLGVAAIFAGILILEVAQRRGEVRTSFRR